MEIVGRREDVRRGASGGRQPLNPPAIDSTARSTPSAAAVHIDRVRGHKFASIGANEQNQFADLLRFAETLHWYVVEELLNQLGRGLRRALKGRFYRPGGDRQRECLA
jgi:hypothetical protein